MSKDWIDQAITLALGNAGRIASEVSDFPHVTEKGRWVCTSDGVWTGGFWAGILWLAYEQQRTEHWRGLASAYTDRLLPRAQDTHNHDLGFMFYPSAIKGWRLTGNEAYRTAARQAATALAAQYNDAAGFIPGWGFFGGVDWSGSVLVDTLMNLPLLVWGAQQGGQERLMQVVRGQAGITLKHHQRADGSFYHVFKFDPETGAPVGGDTYQGLGAETTWTRGQGWAISGLAMLAAMTGEKSYLDAARRTAASFAARLCADHIPPWDFDAPGADQPKDASAGAIVSYGLLRLHALTKDPQYLQDATRMLEALARHCGNSTGIGGLLLHATADLPHGLGIDQSTMYGDYYYLKALVTLRNVHTS